MLRAAVSLLAAFLWAAGELMGAESSEAEQDFKNCVSAQGAEYATARDELLRRGDQAVAILKSKAAESTEPQERLLAEILLSRLQHADEFAGLEKTFDEKVRLIKLGHPVRTILGRPRTDVAFNRGLLLPQESPPTKAGSGRDLSPEVMEFYKNTRLPESPHWKPLLGEIVLKGWLPMSPITLPPAPSPPGPDARPSDWGDPYTPGPPTVTSDGFVEQALLLIGKLREERAAEHVLAIVQDAKQPSRKRALAARSLGFMKAETAVEALCQLAEDNGTRPIVRLESFRALGRIGSAKATRTLERIGAWEKTKLPGNLGPGRWAAEARLALREIHGELP